MASSSTMRLASSGLRELRLHLCQSSAASAGVREFITKHYVPLKEQNPKFPILVRECSGCFPRLYARYGFGQEKSQDLTNFNADQVLQAVYAMAKS